MRHKIRLKKQERIKAWIMLCDFFMELKSKNFPEKKFEDYLKNLRRGHLKRDFLLLSKLKKLE
ncbi:MAG: hypothetical protein B6D56_06600 [Candidatus Omnitrophica bacterium 4484_70.1]|nr:MAG: hypothetical protein B6D56_06600 [Candidatus Omnitrophica bacterium 4484_70.1]